VASRIVTQKATLDGEVVQRTSLKFTYSEYHDLRELIEQKSPGRCKSCDKQIYHVHRDFRTGDVREDYCTTPLPQEGYYGLSSSGYVAEPFVTLDVYLSETASDAQQYLYCNGCFEEDSYGDTWYMYCEGCDREIYYDQNYTDGYHWAFPGDGDYLCKRCWQEEALRDGLSKDLITVLCPSFWDLSKAGSLIDDFIDNDGRWDAQDSGWHLIAEIDYNASRSVVAIARGKESRESWAFEVAAKAIDRGYEILFAKGHVNYRDTVGMFWRRP
jgi:hypothetical protein